MLLKYNDEYSFITFFNISLILNSKIYNKYIFHVHLVIMVCCCIRFRIPRTKQEIEADYQRKQITKKFREKLQQIKNSDMDEMDLQKGKFTLTFIQCFVLSKICYLM